MNRGVNGREVFAGDADREMFLQLVKEYKEICGARVYHWVLMGNHYHILAEVVYENLRGFVGGIQQCYAQYHHGYTGMQECSGVDGSRARQWKLVSISAGVPGT